MDITSARPAVGSNTHGRPETVLYREAVSTELPPTQRVSQPVAQGQTGSPDDRRAGDGAARTAQLYADRQARAGRIADTLREAMFNRIDTIDQDKNAATLVYRTIDAVTGDVVKQYPDDMVLKLRTYAREMARKEEQKADDTARVEKIA
ncbi:hypothetical protein E8L99_21130 [Phreatobacter aquaticus]|uniref:Flagellar protein FlaG n=1 Tax=Phreatobacter aquaticus TaxID=2570229 RepID=A0A4D7QK64_9HYPH|nr:hypothetical protein [Phreatobacter aquaticus]QCK88080.1 hypothetical protein E8L99_21130 [Phreatobacter aquaticus]